MNITRMLNRIKDGEPDNTLDNNNGMYQYTPTPTEIVMENPERFIIPECLSCCLLLWSKGIDTVQCGNYEDAPEAGYWVELNYDCLSDENKRLLKQLSEKDSRVSFCEGIQRDHNYIIRVKRVNNPDPSQELCEVADNLLLQDTRHYSTNEDLLESYKRAGGEPVITETGNVYFEVNLERKDATLSDALRTIEHPELYVAEEGRLYHSQHALNVHLNYLNNKGKESELKL